MPDENAAEIPFAGGKVSSSKSPRFELIPTVALVRLADRFELGLERKADKAWNAMTPNQEVLQDRAFVLSRIAHVISHALKLRDKVIAGGVMGDDDAAAILWGGAFLVCASAAKVPLNCSACGGTGVFRQMDSKVYGALETDGAACPACRGTGKQGGSR